MGSVTQLGAPALPEVVGYVEAFTGDRVLGWAWGPTTPDQRAKVELRLGDLVVARGPAAQTRPDLAANGIGDGNHAFELVIPEAYRGRRAELLVFASVAEGAAVAIGAPPQAEAMSTQLGRVLGGLEALAGSQRLLHRRLQAGLPGASAETSAIASLAAKQAEFAEQLATVERFVVRLDEHLLARAPGPSAAAKVPRAALWALAAAGVALVVSVAGLVRCLVV